MRIFFIVVAAVLFARFVEASVTHLAKAVDRLFDPEIEKLQGMTREEYDLRVAKEHPYRTQLIPLFWITVVVVGFLWAILSR